MDIAILAVQAILLYIGINGFLNDFVLTPIAIYMRNENIINQDIEVDIRVWLHALIWTTFFLTFHIDKVL